MTCQELAVHIDAFLDDELFVMENLRVQAHLVFCQECRKIVESEAKLRNLIEADAVAERAPAQLRERILRSIGERPSPGRSRALRPQASRIKVFAAGALAGAAALGVAFAAVTYLTSHSSREVWPAAAELVGKHALYSRGGEALQVASQDVSALASWLGGKVDFAIKLPPLARPGERLLGGRLSSIADGPAAYLLYERGGRRISLFVFRGLPPLAFPETSRTVEGVKFYTASLQGRSVVWWDEGDVSYAAVSDGGLGDLLEFGLLCVRGRTFPTSGAHHVPAAQG